MTPTKIMALVAVLTLLPSVVAIGVTQDYMANNYVEVPLGGSTCHRVWLATEPTIAHGQVKLHISSALPSYISVDLNEDGIYNTTSGSSDAIIFRIDSPDGADVGDIRRISFVVSGIDTPMEGMVPITGNIGSGFDIKVVDSSVITPDRCNQLPRNLGENVTITPATSPPTTTPVKDDPSTIKPTCTGADCGLPDNDAVTAEIVPPFDWMPYIVAFGIGCICVVLLLRRKNGKELVDVNEEELVAERKSDIDTIPVDETKNIM